MARWKGEYLKLSTQEGYFNEGAARSEITFKGWQFWIFIDSKGPQLFYYTELTLERPFEHFFGLYTTVNTNTQAENTFTALCSRISRMYNKGRIFL